MRSLEDYDHATGEDHRGGHDPPRFDSVPEYAMVEEEVPNQRQIGHRVQDDEVAEAKGVNIDQDREGVNADAAPKFRGAQCRQVDHPAILSDAGAE